MNVVHASFRASRRSRAFRRIGRKLAPTTVSVAVVGLVASAWTWFPAASTPVDAHPEQVLTGAARVVDGDTLDLAAVRVRLHGIDAPEGRQSCRDAAGRTWACGETARHSLDAMTRGRAVICSGREKDIHGRLLAICMVGNQDLNAGMVRTGMAWAFRRYSNAYHGAEREARAGRRGVFAADNTPPWEHRSGRT